MKAWEVVAIIRDGEHACEECLVGNDERLVWDDAPNCQELMEEKGIGILFASDATGDEVCGRCGAKILQ